ncbi:hypothetical protein CPJCM30710_21260 [Clostridium polyendosporum]|uniref:Twitching motility protein PilT n=1 Tax=Clostridium polyendosporum TaxID=69208 RepID=A0A919VGJ7_9CLOT|nr:hypothetical protein [Clostridium polyendosporum]GIM29460.1 hypothetical protein CPJCM30710_21260 [Clostridium polyendosporum]
MIQVFCNKRGSGKTKNLINLANTNVLTEKGNSVYIDDDNRPMLQLDKKIRFISTQDFLLRDYEGLYGFLCGIISEDYDIENIYIDGLSNIVDGNAEEVARLFFKLDDIVDRFGINVYINVNDDNEMPDLIKKYTA